MTCRRSRKKDNKFSLKDDPNSEGQSYLNRVRDNVTDDAAVDIAAV